MSNESGTFFKCSNCTSFSVTCLNLFHSELLKLIHPQIWKACLFPAYTGLQRTSQKDKQCLNHYKITISLVIPWLKYKSYNTMVITWTLMSLQALFLQLLFFSIFFFLHCWWFNIIHIAEKKKKKVGIIILCW